MISIRDWPDYIRWFVAAFLLVCCVGYAIGLIYVYHNTGLKPAGVADHYHGSDAAMKFGKSKGEMLQTIHNHLLGMGMLFFLVGGLFAFSSAGPRFKKVCMVETMLTLLSTFGGLALVAAGYRLWLWVIYPSSVLMMAGFAVMSATVFWNCLTPNRG